MHEVRATAIAEQSNCWLSVGPAAFVLQQLNKFVISCAHGVAFVTLAGLT